MIERDYFCVSLYIVFRKIILVRPLRACSILTLYTWDYSNWPTNLKSSKLIWKHKLTWVGYTSLVGFTFLKQNHLFYFALLVFTKKHSLLVLILLVLSDMFMPRQLFPHSQPECTSGHAAGRNNKSHTHTHTYLALFDDPLDSIWHHVGVIFQAATQYSDN